MERVCRTQRRGWTRRDQSAPDLLERRPFTAQSGGRRSLGTAVAMRLYVANTSVRDGWDPAGLVAPSARKQPRDHTRGSCARSEPTSYLGG